MNSESVIIGCCMIQSPCIYWMPVYDIIVLIFKGIQCIRHIYQYIKILVVCLSVCVCDGCGRGRNKFAGRVQNYRVPCAKIIACVPAVLSPKFSSR